MHTEHQRDMYTNSLSASDVQKIRGQGLSGQIATDFSDVNPNGSMTIMHLDWGAGKYNQRRLFQIAKAANVQTSGANLIRRKSQKKADNSPSFFA